MTFSIKNQINLIREFFKKVVNRFEFWFSFNSRFFNNKKLKIYTFFGTQYKCILGNLANISWEIKQKSQDCAKLR